MNVSDNNLNSGVPLIPPNPLGVPDKVASGQEKINFQNKDTVETFADLSNQNVRMTGEYSLAPNHIQLYGNKGPVDSKPTDAASNPWFNKSFLATFTSIMAEMYNLQSKTKFLETIIELKARVNILEIAMTQSDLTKMSFDSQSAQKLVEAISCFAQACTAGIFLTQMAAIGSQSKQLAKDEIAAEKLDAQNGVNGLKAKNDDLKFENGTLNDEIKDIKNPPVVDVGPNAPAPLTTAEKNQKIADLEAQIQKNDKTIESNDKTISSREKSIQAMDGTDYYNSRVVTKMQILNQQMGFKQTMCESSIRAVQNFIQGSLLQEQGAIEALKALYEGYMQAMVKYSDSASKAADNAANNLGNINDFINKITDSTFRAHSLGQMA